MRRSTRKWLTLAGCMVAAGLLILAIGSGMGGFPQVRDWVENGELSWPFGYGTWGWGDSVKFNDRYPIYEGAVSRTKIEDAAQIERLNFDVGGGRVVIRTSEDGGYWFSSDNAKKYQCYADNGVLELRVKGGSWVANHSDEHVITLWIPKEVSYREIDLEIGGGILEADMLAGTDISIEIGAGSIEADTLTGDRISLELGAGEITVRSAEADQFSVEIGAGEAAITSLSSRTLKVDVGAGQITLEESAVQDADISVSMGQIRYQGMIAGDLDADCSMGQIDLELTGYMEDHNYEVNCSMGEVSLGGESVSGVAGTRKIDFNAASDFDINCSMGGISVTFKEP